MENKLYLVVRYCDDLPPHEYGVSDSCSLIGAFTDKTVTQTVK